MAACVALAGCAADGASRSEEGAFVQDPYEGFNRRVHTLNVAVDRAALRPASQAYDAVTPPFGKYVVSNALNTLDAPRVIANNVLQGDLEGTLSAFMRLSMNVAFGAGGLLDPATEMGLPHEDNDFGLTLARHGLGEGAYLELPLLGPSNVRDAVGMVVDTAFNPFTYVTGTPGTEIGYGVVVVDAVDTRHDNAAGIDQALYESDDSYVTSRSAYVQLRRRQVAGEATEESLPDVFAD